MYLARVEKRGRAEGTLDCYYCKAGHLLRVLGEGTDINPMPNSVEDDYIDTRRDENARNHTIHKELVVLRGALKIAAKAGLFHRPLELLRADNFGADYVPKKRSSRSASSICSFPKSQRSAARRLPSWSTPAHATARCGGLSGCTSISPAS